MRAVLMCAHQRNIGTPAAWIDALCQPWTLAGHLLRSAAHPGATLGRLYPDLVIGPLVAPLGIVDAKYKPLADPRGVDREDLYQLTSYLSAHPVSPAPLGLLAYTRFPDQGEVARAERFGPWQLPTGNEVRFARFPITEAECVRAFASLLR